MTQQTMIERVARALIANPPNERYEERDGVTILVRDYLPTARAAIEAMRDPTDVMRGAMRTATMYLAGGYGGQYAWDAAIDAALKEDAAT